jgi:hypothetical protein
MICKAAVDADAGIFVRRRPFAARQFVECKRRIDRWAMVSFDRQWQTGNESTAFRKAHAVGPKDHQTPLLGTILADN